MKKKRTIKPTKRKSKIPKKKMLRIVKEVREDARALQKVTTVHISFKLKQALKLKATEKELSLQALVEKILTDNLGRY